MLLCLYPSWPDPDGDPISQESGSLHIVQHSATKPPQNLKLQRVAAEEEISLASENAAKN